MKNSLLLQSRIKVSTLVFGIGFLALRNLFFMVIALRN